MSKFGDLLGGKTPAPAPAAPAQPTPVAVPSEPAEAIAPDPIVVEEVVEENKTVDIDTTGPSMDVDIAEEKDQTEIEQPEVKEELTVRPVVEETAQTEAEPEKVEETI